MCTLGSTYIPRILTTYIIILCKCAPSALHTYHVYLPHISLYFVNVRPRPYIHTTYTLGPTYIPRILTTYIIILCKCAPSALHTYHVYLPHISLYFVNVHPRPYIHTTYTYHIYHYTL